MQSLTYNPVESSGDFTCPPKDQYTIELIEIGAFEQRLAFGSENMMNTQSRLTFRIVDFDYDEEIDDTDWNGTQVSDYYVFFKEDQETGKKFETWCHEKSKAYPMLAALLGHDPEQGENIDLHSLLNRRVKATVEPKESGYPKITNPIKIRQKRKRAEDTGEPEAEAGKASPFKRDNAA